MKSVEDLANWFLSKEGMPHKKLQKLCYYAVAWHYTLYDSKLVSNDSFEAWVHGPVSPDLWHEYKHHGWDMIPKIENAPDFGEDLNDFLEIVYNTYGDFSGHQLEALTHHEEPWLDARGDLKEYEASNNLIDVEKMKAYYQSIYDSSQND